MSDTQANDQPLDDDDAIVKALSYHGAFLKKYVLSVIRDVPELEIVKEELAVEFGIQTRAIDIVARDKENVLFVIECKKVIASKKWVFFKDSDQFYRVLRRMAPRRQQMVCNELWAVSKKMTPSGASSFMSQAPVCTVFVRS